MSAKKKCDVLPRYLTHEQARELVDEVECSIARVRDEFAKKHGAEMQGLEHEIALALARAAVRYGVDLLPATAAQAIDRLEVAVAEAAGTLERRKIPDPLATIDAAGDMHAGNGHHVRGCRCEVCR